MSLKGDFIKYAVREALEKSKKNKIRVMDLGCGTAAYVPSLLKEIPNIEYIGVEPIKSSYEAAKKNLAGIENVKLHFQLGYDSISDETEASCDLVFSLSVLEHIKDLDRFLALSVKFLASNGLMVHRYDLGHALHPHSYKEKIHVWLGNNLPEILPERQFVKYLDYNDVEKLYHKYNLHGIKTTFHQMPNHKALEKFMRESNSNVVNDLFVWEMNYQSEFQRVPQKIREKLFPAIAVWGIKK